MSEKEQFKMARRLLKSGKARVLVSYDMLQDQNAGPFVSPRYSVVTDYVEGMGPDHPNAIYLGNGIPQACVHDQESTAFELMHRGVLEQLSGLLQKIADNQGNLYFRGLEPGFEVHYQGFQSAEKEKILILFPLNILPRVNEQPTPA